MTNNTSIYLPYFYLRYIKGIYIVLNIVLYFLTKLPAKGGLRFGTMGSSAVLLLILLGFIIYQYMKNNKIIVTEEQIVAFESIS